MKNSIKIFVILVIVLIAAGFVEMVLKPAGDGWQLYTNEKYGISFKYPKDFTLQETENGGYFDELGIFELSLTMPQKYQKDTDFTNGRIDIMVSPKTDKCYKENTIQSRELTATKEINRTVFHYDPKQPFSDAAMGGVRAWTSLFAVIKNDACYRIAKDVIYRQLQGFAEPPYPPHFDEKMVNEILDKVISSVTLKNTR
jgi:hypothetical protein